MRDLLGRWRAVCCCFSPLVSRGCFSHAQLAVFLSFCCFLVLIDLCFCSTSVLVASFCSSCVGLLLFPFCQTQANKQATVVRCCCVCVCLFPVQAQMLSVVLKYMNPVFLFVFRLGGGWYVVVMLLLCCCGGGVVVVVCGVVCSHIIHTLLAQPHGVIGMYDTQSHHLCIASSQPPSFCVVDCCEAKTH